LEMHYFGPFCVDERRLVLTLRGEPLPIGPKVVKTLLTFVESNGKVLSKNELLDSVWGDADVGEGTLTQNVYVLRKLFTEHCPDAKIQTIPRRGYRFLAPAPRVRARRFASYAFSLAVIAALVITIGNSYAPARRTHAPTLSSAGSQSYALGMYYWRQRNRPALAKSVQYFTAVMQSDPHDARGYAGLSEAYSIQASYGYGPHEALYARARSLALRALALDPKSAEAHAALGQAEDLPGTRAAAAAEYRTAIALDPGYAPPRQWYGQILMQRGRYADAYAQLTRASQLDPTCVSTLNALAIIAYLSRNYTEALTYAQRTIELSPQRPDAHEALGLAREARGETAQAIVAYRQYGMLCGNHCRSDAAALLAHAYASMGNVHVAQHELHLALTDDYFPRGERIAPNLVAALLALGQRSEALAAVRSAARQGGLYTSDPRLDPVRSDPSFRRYLN
jgi:DNA-binding winged helix-turn-helix (wHTH) protein/tetratricopeptide (TPR) repeat protein